MTLTDEQKAILQRLSDATIAHKSEVLTARADALRAADERIADAERRKAELAREAYNASIPITRIAEALLTTNRKTVHKVILSGATS
jgi:gamma-glutamyl phosphate reductase